LSKKLMVNLNMNYQIPSYRLMIALHKGMELLLILQFRFIDKTND